MFTKVQAIFDSAPWDVVGLFGLHAAVFLYGLLNRRNHMLSLIFSLYFSQIIFEHFHVIRPFIQSESASMLEVFYFQTALYLVMIALFATIIYKKAFGDGGTRLRFWKILLLVAAIGGLATSSFLRLIDIDKLYQISPLVEKIFTGENQILLWLLLPILAILTLIRKA
ncbi:MAG: hypothetical protein AAB930_01420 [Patescibacteria group bacterium]